MRFFHLGDLHIGKQLHGFSLIEDQKAVLDQVVALASVQKPDAVLVAGDLYDRSIPPGEAVCVLDDFLTGLAGLGVPVFLVSGNHDSPERLSFGSRLMRSTGVHLCGGFTGCLESVRLHDPYGPVDIHLLPFVKPGMVRPFYPDAAIESYDEAVRTVIGAATLDAGARHVLVAHQFITSSGREPERSDSETFAVGGVDNIDASAFASFDYVALGHLHGPQAIGREAVRYAGSPLKYSFSEVHHRKGVVQVDLGAGGELDIMLLPLAPARDLREVRGPLAALLATAQESGTADGAPCQDYIRAVLTDEDELFDPYGQLRLFYPNLMTLDFENSRTRTGPSAAAGGAAADDLRTRDPLALFSDFFTAQNGAGPSPEQLTILKAAFEAAGGVS